MFLNNFLSCQFYSNTVACLLRWLLLSSFLLFSIKSSQIDDVWFFSLILVSVAHQKPKWLWVAEAVPFLLQWGLRQDDYKHHRCGLCLPEWILGLYRKACHYTSHWQVKGHLKKEACKIRVGKFFFFSYESNAAFLVLWKFLILLKNLKILS